MKKRSIVTLTDRQVVKFAIGEAVTFVLIRLIALALLAGAAWWIWSRIEPWWRQLSG